MKQSATLPLKKELEFYKKNKEKLLKHYENQFILIKGNTIVGAFTTEREAYEAGVAQFGIEPFFIKQVLKEEQLVSHPALITGLLYARS